MAVLKKFDDFVAESQKNDNGIFTIEISYDNQFEFEDFVSSLQTSIEDAIKKHLIVKRKYDFSIKNNIITIKYNYIHYYEFEDFVSTIKTMMKDLIKEYKYKLIIKRTAIGDL